MTDTVAWVTTPNGETREQRTEVQAELGCTRCGSVVELEAETDCWTLDEKDGRWHHESYGPAHGVCCGLLYAYWWDGPHVYDLESAGDPDEQEGPDE